MSDNVFLNHAPAYWNAGIPVMPLKTRSKAPILNEWTAYGRVAPTETIKNHWLATYPRSNIGLPFGPASGLCAIDIDTIDEALTEIIMDCLPPSPWTRIGAKGCALIYRWAGQKNFKIRSEDGMILEMLGQGNQLVLPPSIHPDTGEAYRSNVDLWDVMDKIQPLPMDIETTLRTALGVVKGVSLAHEGRSAPLQVVPRGERDIQLVKHAGYLARVVLGIDKKHKFTLAEAIEHMATWVEGMTAQIADDDMDPSKGVGKLLEFLVKDVEGGKTLPDGWDEGLTSDQIAHPTIAALVATNQVIRWTFSKARDWINEQIELRPDDADWAISKVNELVEKVAKDDNFRPIDFDSLIPALQRALGDVSLGKPELRKLFKAARQGEIESAEDHETIARQVLEQFERTGEVRYYQGSFWQWNGSCFKQLSREDIFQFVAEGIKGNQLSRRHNDYEAITKTISVLARGELAEALEIGVNFANGFLDSEGVLHDHSPKFGKTFTMPFNYIPERAAEAHKWLEYLENAWGDEPDYDQRVRALQEAFAATMFGVGADYQRAILIFGRAGTGKTQVLDVLKAMMPPEAICSLPPHQWSERFVMAEMVGRTLNICGELPESGSIAGDVFKEVVVGSEVRTERKQQSGFMYKPMATHWFASNFLPRSKDTSEGFIRRWLILEFDKIVPEEDRIPNYAEILVAEEREAIAAWAVQGLQRLQKQGGYTLPESHKNRLGQVKRANNSIAAFLAVTSRVVVTGEKGDTVDLMALFDQYVWYSKEIARTWPVGYERFHQMVEELRFEVTEYVDTLAGHKKLQAHGLKMADLSPEAKWKSGA